MVELRQLRYFVTVAEQRHFGRAAQELHIVQPAVSQQVARLERELGLMLFDRSRRQVALTADGQTFLPYARRVLFAADRAVRAAADLTAGASGVLRLGSSDVLGPHLEEILMAFRQRRPAATIELIAGSTPDKLAAVAAGDLDAAFVRAPQPAPGVVVHRLWDEPLLVAIPAPRAPAGDLVDLATLADLPLAQAPRSANLGVFDLITSACRAAGFTPLPGPILSSVQDLLAAYVGAGRCWTFLYANTPRVSVPANVVLLSPNPAIGVPTGLAVPSHRRRPLVDDLIAATDTATAPP